MFVNNSNKSNLIQEENKRKLNLGNASYHSAQNILSSRLLSLIFLSMKHYFKQGDDMFQCMCAIFRSGF
jgi:hypothetical protein